MNYAYINPPALDSSGRILRPSERFARSSSSFLTEQHVASSSSNVSPSRNVNRLSTAHLGPSYGYSNGNANRSPLSDKDISSSNSDRPSAGSSRDISTRLSNSHYSGTASSLYTPATSIISSPALSPPGSSLTASVLTKKEVRTPSILTPPHSPPAQQQQFKSNHDDNKKQSQSSASPIGQAFNNFETRRITLPDEEESRKQLRDLKSAVLAEKEGRSTPKKLKGRHDHSGYDSNDTPLKSPRKKSFFKLGVVASASNTKSNGQALNGSPRLNGTISGNEDLDQGSKSDGEKRPSRSTTRSFVGSLGKRSKSLGRSSANMQREIMPGNRVHETVVPGNKYGDSTSSLGEDEWILLTQSPEEATSSKGTLQQSDSEKSAPGFTGSADPSTMQGLKELSSDITTHLDPLPHTRPASRQYSPSPRPTSPEPRSAQRVDDGSGRSGTPDKRQASNLQMQKQSFSAQRRIPVPSPARDVSDRKGEVDLTASEGKRAHKYRTSTDLMTFSQSNLFHLRLS